MKFVHKMKKHKSLLCFIGGAAAMGVGTQVAKSEKTRQACVTGLAKGMKMQKNAQAAYHSIREDAQDICYDAKTMAGGEEEEEA